MTEAEDACSDVARWWALSRANRHARAHTHTSQHFLTLRHTFSRSHYCCWRNLWTWPLHHLHSPCCDPEAPGQSHCRGEGAASPLRHQTTATGNEASGRLRWHERKVIILWNAKHWLTLLISASLSAPLYSIWKLVLFAKFLMLQSLM